MKKAVLWTLAVLTAGVAGWVFRCELGFHPEDEVWIQAGQFDGDEYVSKWVCTRCGQDAGESRVWVDERLRHVKEGA